jgi:hypothetical protein
VWNLKVLSVVSEVGVRLGQDAPSLGGWSVLRSIYCLALESVRRKEDLIGKEMESGLLAIRIKAHTLHSTSAVQGKQYVSEPGKKDGTSVRIESVGLYAFSEKWQML